MFIRIKGLKFARSFGGKGKVCIFALRNTDPYIIFFGRGGVAKGPCLARKEGGWPCKDGFRTGEGLELRRSWSDGRVARQRSAKPCTAVRVRFRPHRNRVVDICNAVFVLFCHTFVIHRDTKLFLT